MVKKYLKTNNLFILYFYLFSKKVYQTFHANIPLILRKMIIEEGGVNDFGNFSPFF